FSTRSVTTFSRFSPSSALMAMIVLLHASNNSYWQAIRQGSRLEFDIPVEIIQPALVQVVGREGAAIVVQVVHCGWIGRLMREHLDVLRQPVGLAQVTWRTGRHD